MWPKNPLTKYRADALYQAQFQDVTCLAGDSVGDVVYIRGDASASRWLVGQTDPLNSSKMPGVGILVSKASATEGVIQVVGPLDGLYAGLDYTKLIYVGLSGTVVQTAPGGSAAVQEIGFVTDNDAVYLTGNTVLAGASTFDGSAILVSRDTGEVLINQYTGNVLVGRQ